MAYFFDPAGELFWLAAAAVPAIGLTVFLLLKSVKDFSRTGPQLRGEVRSHYGWYLTYCLLRLAGWTTLINFALAAGGLTLYAALVALTKTPASMGWGVAFATTGITAVAALQFCRHLLYLPGGIEVSSNYRMSRFYRLWRLLSPARLRIAARIILAMWLAPILAGAWVLHQQGQNARAGFMLALTAALLALALYLSRDTEVKPTMSRRDVAGGRDKPNIVMIGADTLRADRLGVSGNTRGLTPYIDALAAQATYFTDCYVPCARTAPSLASLLTGAWPWQHGVRDNFMSDADTELPVPTLPRLLKEAGYITAAVSDWAGADLGKLSFGFDILDLPKDQWNVKYLMRQGPKDIRLFLSLFVHNGFGKRWLPELYYLAGKPMTGEIGRTARHMINSLAQSERPFLLNVFMSTTHAPFGSEYPYYIMYSDPAYAGQSKFVMSGLTEPFEVLERQREGKHSFDIPQILNLYDGCVRSFDDEVARIGRHLEACGLADNTIIVIYSDHGMEFFERETWGQGNSVVVDESARIPLVLYDPRRAGGRRVGDIVRSIDVTPTLMELVGLEVPASMAGVSLVPHMSGSANTVDLPAYVETGIWVVKQKHFMAGHLSYPELPDLLQVADKAIGTLSLRPEVEQLIIRAKDRMLRLGRWKLVAFPVTDGLRFELFDLASDPESRVDVSTANPAILRAMIAQLEKLAMEGGPATGISGSAAAASLPH